LQYDWFWKTDRGFVTWLVTEIPDPASICPGTMPSKHKRKGLKFWSENPKSKARRNQMGMFSWECKGCDQDLKSDEEVRLDGSKGIYDGYGRCGNFDYDGGIEPVAWHQKCYHDATDAEKLDETPSKYARNEGFGYPRADCMPEASWGHYQEPKRLFYKDVPSEQISEYVDFIFAEDEKKEEGAYSFLTARHDDPRKVERGHVTDGDVERAKIERGNRFSHEVEHEPLTDGGVPFPPTDMELKFPTTFVEISELAHDAVEAAKERRFKKN
jgi:hypothetical protein